MCQETNQHRVRLYKPWRVYSRRWQHSLQLWVYSWTGYRWDKLLSGSLCRLYDGTCIKTDEEGIVECLPQPWRTISGGANNQTCDIDLIWSGLPLSIPIRRHDIPHTTRLHPGCTVDAGGCPLLTENIPPHRPTWTVKRSARIPKLSKRRYQLDSRVMHFVPPDWKIGVSGGGVLRTRERYIWNHRVEGEGMQLLREPDMRLYSKCQDR
jgi:hypothetical protein